jgi:predicted transcriptional regulator
MATRKVTFTLDEDTIENIAAVAAYRKQPKSEVVREAIAHYRRIRGPVSEEERRRRVRIFEEYLATAPKRPQSEIDRELAEIRRARRHGGRRHRVE